MFNSQVTAKRFCTTFTTLLLLALTVRCHAGFMKVTGGFDTVAKSGTWTPIAVELENPGNGTIEGVFDVEQGDWAIPVCTAKVYLPANSRKLYHVYARLKEYGDVRVLFRSGNRALSVQKVPLNFAGLWDVTVISVGDRASQLSFLNREKLGGPAGARGNKTIQVGSIPVSQLPDRPSGYEGVDVLVITNLPTSSANPRALKALGMWVASGGTLVVGTGADYRSYQNEFFDELLPVQITGAGQISTFKSLADAGGTPLPAGAMAIAKSTPKAGIATGVISESGAPIYAEREYGAGKVVFLAFDPLSSPFKDWNGQAAFWKGLVSSGNGVPMVVARGLAASMTGGYNPQYDPYAGTRTFPLVVQQNQSIKMPSFSTIALFLLGYIVVLVPINYFVLHKLRRRELAWVTTPVIVLVFTIGAYGIGYTMKGGQLQLNEATFIETSCNARYARVVTEASIFSPASRNYKVTLSDPQSLGQVIPSMDDTNLPAMEIGEQSVMDGLRMAMWSSKLLESTSGVDLGGHLQSDLKLTGNRIQGTIRNNTGLDLDDCALVWSSRSMKIGKIAKGRTASVNLDFASNQALDIDLAPRMLGDQKSRARSFALRAASAGGRPILIATSSDGRRFDVAGQRPKTESCTSYVFTLDYSMGKEFSLGPESIPSKVISATGQSASSSSRRGPGVHVTLYQGGQMLITYRLPAGGSIEMTDVKVTSKPPSRGTASIQVYNRSTGKWETATPGKSLQRPGQYVNTGGEVRVKVTCTNGTFNSWIGISAKGRQK